MTAQRVPPSRVALWLTLSVFVLTCVWLVLSTDGEVAAHFDGSGTVTRTESARSFLVTVGGIGSGIGVLVLAARSVVPRIPAGAFNLPSREAHEYWTDPAHRSENDRLVCEDLEWLGAATLVLLIWMIGVSGTAQGSVSVWALAVPTALYLVSVLAYATSMIVGGRYRVPR